MNPLATNQRRPAPPGFGTPATNDCDPRGANEIRPGDMLELRNVTVVQGRESGFQYKLEQPLAIRRPNPGEPVYDTVYFLDPVDVDDSFPFTANQTVDISLEIVSFGVVGRPNPNDEQTTVNVKFAKPPECQPKVWTA